MGTLKTVSYTHLLLILFSGVLDAFDGGVARAKGIITPFGSVLDSVCDRYSDGLMFLGIIAGAVNGRLMLSPIMPVSYTHLGGVKIGTVGTYMELYCNGVERLKMF